ncbi:MAG: hypothetical protein U9R17_17055 [Thermodesulfobacteriota bacterium]|nr:hypothetical protein [Thermodesulfobacteriota bacterium]
MIAEAIIKNGGLFIPDVGKQIKIKKEKITIQFTILNDSPKYKKDPLTEAAGILKYRNIDPLKYQKDLRDEWQD